jgi:hypothetical protein
MNVPVRHFNTSSIVAMVARNAVAMQRAIASFITRIATALLRIFSKRVDLDHVEEVRGGRERHASPTFL